MTSAETAVKTWGELLAQRSDREPDFPLYTFLRFAGDSATIDDKNSECISIGQLEAAVSSLGGVLREIVPSGERALLVYPSGLEQIIGLYGCFAAGIVAVPTAPPIGNRMDAFFARFSHLVSDAQPRLVLTTQTLMSKLQRAWEVSDRIQPQLPLDWLATDTVPTTPGSTQVIHQSSSADTTVMLQYTSGSISDPKGVALTHRNILANQSMIRAAFEFTGESVIVSWLPQFHDMGLMGNMFQALYSRSRLFFFSPVDFVRNPHRWPQVVSDYAATVSGAPNFAYELCANKADQAQLEMLDLSSWCSAFCGAEPVRAGTLRRFTERFACCGFVPQGLYPCYGLAEATLLVAGGNKAALPVLKHVDPQKLATRNIARPPTDSERSSLLVGSGTQLAGEEICIVDPTSHVRCQTNSVGEIWVKGPHVSPGYWQNPEATAATFGACTTDGGGPFLRTGDLGFMDAEGELFVTGRIKDLIILRGANYYPADIEEVVVRSDSKFRLGGTVAFSVEGDSGERLVVVQELNQDPAAAQETPEALCATVQRALVQTIGFAAHAIAFAHPRTLPKTTSGKLRRTASRELFIQGRLSLWASWCGDALEPWRVPDSRKHMQEMLVQRIAQTLVCEPTEIDPQASLAELGLSSFLLVELQEHLHRLYGVGHFAALDTSQPIYVLADRLWELVIVHEHDQASAAPSPRLIAQHVKTERDLQRAYAFLRRRTAEEMGVLDPVLSSTARDQGDRLASFAVVNRHWQAKQLAISLLAPQFPPQNDNDAVAGLALSEKSDSLLGLTSTTVFERLGVHEYYIFLERHYRERNHVNHFLDWLGAHVRQLQDIEDHPNAPPPFVCSTVSSRAQIWTHQSKVLARMLRQAGCESPRLFKRLDARRPSARKLVADALRNEDNRLALLKRIETTDYGLLDGHEILHQCADPKALSLEALSTLADPTLKPLLHALIHAAQRGDAEFIGLELYWLEPIFVYNWNRLKSAQT